jgi:hypothetical protein
MAFCAMPMLFNHLSYKKDQRIPSSVLKHGKIILVLLHEDSHSVFSSVLNDSILIERIITLMD